jgi:hypothetical protein
MKIRKRTKLNKNVSFLKPFLKGISRIVPMSKLSKIRGYRVATGLNERQQAGITKYHGTGLYVITLKIQKLVEENTKYRYTTLEQILLDLSHELAHLHEWEHTPRHFHIQVKVMTHFAKVLRQLQIQDHSIRINRIRRTNESN